MVVVPRQLPDLSKEEVKNLHEKIYSSLDFGSAVYENPFEVYSLTIFTLTLKKPNDFSIPKSWAAAGRLRVACFLVGLFETLVYYMSLPEYNNLAAWQTKFLYTACTKGGLLNQFWDAVLKKALDTLAAKAELYKEWLRLTDGFKRHKGKDTNNIASGNETTSPSDGVINSSLQELLKEPIEAFFSHEVTRECLSQIGKKPVFEDRLSKLPFLFIIDEAAYLHQTNYMHCFTWVLDNPVVRVLVDIYNETKADVLTEYFFVLMLGTHSQIAHFAPNEIFPSERLAGQPQLLPSPFVSFNWDVNVREFRAPFGLRDSETVFELAQWGRSMWAALFANRSNPHAIERCLEYLKVKLGPAGSHDIRHLELSRLAVMSIRFHLDVDCAAPTRASQLVSSKMRWLVDVGLFRRHITTTYGSEPLLVEAAACMMNSYDEEGSQKKILGAPWKIYISEMMNQLSKGYISRGNHGELTARVLCKYLKETILISSQKMQPRVRHGMPISDLRRLPENERLNQSPSYIRSTRSRQPIITAIVSVPSLLHIIAVPFRSKVPACKLMMLI